MDRTEPAVWTARWIWDEGIPRAAPARHEFRLFRRTFTAPAGARLVVHVSADSRYQLYLNGQRVAVGPCKGDAWTKFYETVDLTPLLRAGRNVLAARVLHFMPADPPNPPTFGLSAVTRSAVGGFLLQGGIEGGETLDTDERWKVARDESVSFHANDGALLLGETEAVDGAKQPHSWREVDFDDSRWAAAVPFWGAMDPARVLNLEFFGPWSLTPRPIPPMFETPHGLTVARGTRPGGPDGMGDHARALGLALAGEAPPVTLRPGSRWEVILDAGELTTGYPALRLSGGRGALARLTYAEAFGEGQDGNAWVRKGVRDDPASGGIYGQWDEYRPGGGEEVYEPFWFRTFRFIRLNLTVGEEPLTVGPLRYTETGYPLEVKSAFECSEPKYRPLWDISIRTVRRCMHETYEDCPYYEQLQYAMDTRLEALYSSYLSADDRLMRKAIHDYHSGWHPSGLLQARTPCVYPQIIPGFSLWWVLMVRDHWDFYGEADVPRRYRSTVDSVLDWFDRRRDSTGLVGPFHYWPFVDWVSGWHHGVPPGMPEKPATVFSLLYAIALNAAADLAAPAGYPHRAGEYRHRAAEVNDAVNRACWDTERGLYRQGPETPGFDVHCQAFAIMSGAATGDRARAIAARSLEDRSLSQMNWAMQFFLFRALRTVGMYDRAFSLYSGWLGLAEKNVTTWPEDPIHGRSDCHGWGSVPIYEFCAEVLGVQPAEPGFARIRVAPQPGPLTWAKGEVITPRGPVRVSWRRDGGDFYADVSGPAGVPLDLVRPETP